MHTGGGGVTPQDAPPGMLVFRWLTQRALIITGRMSCKCLSPVYPQVTLWLGNVTAIQVWLFSIKPREEVTVLFLVRRSLFSFPTRMILKPLCWYSETKNVWALQSCGSIEYTSLSIPFYTWHLTGCRSTQWLYCVCLRAAILNDDTITLDDVRSSEGAGRGLKLNGFTHQRAQRNVFSSRFKQESIERALLSAPECSGGGISRTQRLPLLRINCSSSLTYLRDTRWWRNKQFSVSKSEGNHLLSWHIEQRLNM